MLLNDSVVFGDAAGFSGLFCPLLQLNLLLLDRFDIGSPKIVIRKAADPQATAISIKRNIFFLVSHYPRLKIAISKCIFNSHGARFVNPLGGDFAESQDHIPAKSRELPRLAKIEQQHISLQKPQTDQCILELLVVDNVVRRVSSLWAEQGNAGVKLRIS